MRLTFIVGTGRCGSTMLSRLLHLHPQVLSVSEFFCTLAPGSPELPVPSIDGRQLWNVLASPEPSLDAIVRCGLATQELCYPYGRGRFDVETGVPRISHMTLPALTDDPDALFDKLAAEVPAWPTRSTAGQIRALFDYLAGLMGRTVTVERTAASLFYAQRLHQMFPDARFVHFYRHGPDCALSMSTHPGVRAMALMEHAGLLGMGRRSGAARATPPAGLMDVLSPPLDMRRVMAYPAPPLEAFGRLWSRQIVAGVAALRKLPGETWIPMAYEDFLSDPQRELARLAEFAGAPPAPGWLAAASAMVDRRRNGKAAKLAPASYESLLAACEPGLQALAGASEQALPPHGAPPSPAYPR